MIVQSRMLRRSSTGAQRRKEGRLPPPPHNKDASKTACLQPRLSATVGNTLVTNPVDKMPIAGDGTTSEVTLSDVFVPYEIEFPSSASGTPDGGASPCSAEVARGNRRWRRHIIIVIVLVLVVVGAVVAIAVALTRPNNDDSSNSSKVTEGTVPLTIVIQLDDKPQETGWALACQSQPVVSVRAGTYTEPNIQIQMLAYVLEGEICVLSVVDTAGDGIDNGFFEVYFGDFTRRLIRVTPKPILVLSGDFTVENQGIFTAADPSSSSGSPTSTSSPQPTAAPTLFPTPMPTLPQTTGMPTPEVTVGDPTTPTPPPAAPSPSTPSPTPTGPAIPTPPPTPNPTSSPLPPATPNPTPATPNPTPTPPPTPNPTPTPLPTPNPTPLPSEPGFELKFENSFSELCLSWDEYEPFNFQFDVPTDFSVRTDEDCNEDERNIWSFLVENVFGERGLIRTQMDDGSYRCLAVAYPGQDQIAYPLDLLPCVDNGLFQWRLAPTLDDDLYRIRNTGVGLCIDFCKSCDENNVWVRRCEQGNDDQDFFVLRG